MFLYVTLNHYQVFKTAKNFTINNDHVNLVDFRELDGSLMSRFL